MFTLKIIPDGPDGQPGEPFDVTTTSRDIVRWEAGGNRQNPRSMGSLNDNFKMSDVTDLAWFAASRRGLTDLDIKQWREQVDVDITKRQGDDDDGDDEESGPTPGDR